MYIMFNMTNINMLPMNLKTWLNSEFVLNAFPDLNVNYFMFNNASNFFNPSTIIDIFYEEVTDVLGITRIQSTLNTGTKNFIINA